MFTFCNDTVNNNLDTVNDTVFEKNIEKFLCRTPPYQGNTLSFQERYSPFLNLPKYKHLSHIKILIATVEF